MNKIEYAQKLMTMQREESEPNLIDKVVELLNKYKFSTESINIFLNHQFVVNCQDKVFEVQRVNINRFWNIQLMSLGSKSIEARSLLLQDGSMDNWLEFFEKIIPLIKENNIPRVE